MEESRNVGSQLTSDFPLFLFQVAMIGRERIAFRLWNGCRLFLNDDPPPSPKLRIWREVRELGEKEEAFEPATNQMVGTKFLVLRIEFSCD